MGLRAFSSSRNNTGAEFLLFLFYISFLGIFIFEKLIARCSTTILAINLHRSLTFIQTGGTQGLGRASGVPFSKQGRRDGVDERLERNLSVSFRFGFETFMCPPCRFRIEKQRPIIRFFTFDHLKHASTRFSRPNSEWNIFFILELYRSFFAHLHHFLYGLFVFSFSSLLPRASRRDRVACVYAWFTSL